MKTVEGSRTKKNSKSLRDFDFFSRETLLELSYRGDAKTRALWKGHERKKNQNRSAILHFFSGTPLRIIASGGCENTSIHVGMSKTLIWSISGPWDLLETIPRAISDRMVRVPFDFVSSRAILGQNKVPRALSTSGVFLHVQKPPGKRKCCTRFFA